MPNYLIWINLLSIPLLAYWLGQGTNRTGKILYGAGVAFNLAAVAYWMFNRF